MKKKILNASIATLFSAAAYAGPIASGGLSRSLTQTNVFEMNAINESIQHGKIGELMFQGGRRSDGVQYAEFGPIISIKKLDLPRINGVSSPSKPGVVRYLLTLGSFEDEPTCSTEVSIRSGSEVPAEEIKVISVDQCQPPAME